MIIIQFDAFISVCFVSLRGQLPGMKTNNFSYVMTRLKGNVVCMTEQALSKDSSQVINAFKGLRLLHQYFLLVYAF